MGLWCAGLWLGCGSWAKVLALAKGFALLWDSEAAAEILGLLRCTWGR